MGNKYTEAQKKASLKYLQERTDDIRLRVPKGTKSRWQEAAASKGVSMTQFVVETMERELGREDK